MVQIEVRPLQGLLIEEQPVEIVERKGLGHPDTICDMLSERFSVALSRHYIDRFGIILHHNVDKALLSAGRAEARFGGGQILKPIEIYLGGRASLDVRGARVPVREIATEVVRSWIGDNLHMSHLLGDVEVKCLVQPGSSELVELFMRQREAGKMLANDTSIGVGYAPMSGLERIVLEVEEHVNTRGFKRDFPSSGEDVKVMGVRVRDRITLTVACAFVGAYLHDSAAYIEAKEQLAMTARNVAAALTRREVAVDVNVADNVTSGDIFLTVAGTSAEAGDDGETGRGNRINGLITPNRPMTLEAVAGKNPITHVGKIYNATARNIAQELVAVVPGVTDAECRLVSRIGTPIDEPAIVDVQLRTLEGGLSSQMKRHASEIVCDHLHRATDIWRSFFDGVQRVA